MVWYLPSRESRSLVRIKTQRRTPEVKAMLFHEIYSSYYIAVSSILKEAVRGTLTGKKLNALVQQHAFGESLLTIPDGLKGEKWRLIHKDLSTPLEEEPSMPLTILEKRWMKALLLDPRIRLFMPDMAGLEEIGLEDVEPLFTPDMIVYYDRYSDGDDYENPEYIRHFRTILQALQEKQDIFVSFESRLHAKPQLVVTPHYLEYSEKDDRFRLVAAGHRRRWVINLSRITACEPAHRNDRVQLKEAPVKTVTFELEDRRNAMERVLLHFSHLEKETKRLDDRRYRVTLKYDRQDETEMVIRILSFGSAIRVTEPDSFVALIRKRIRKQLAIQKNNIFQDGRETNGRSGTKDVNETTDISEIEGVSRTNDISEIKGCQRNN